MKKVLTIGLLSSTIIFSGYAQEAAATASAQLETSVQQNEYRINQRALEQLDLSDNQKEQIRVINEAYRTQMQVMIKSEISADQRKDQRNQFNKTRTNKIISILTENQIKKLKQIQKDVEEDKEDEGSYKMKSKSDDGKVKIKVKKDD